MSDELQEDRTFENQDFSYERPFAGEFQSCTFKDCNVMESDLSEVIFIDCAFEDCNFSMANLSGTGLQGVRFWQCKLMGVDFSACSDFALGLRFEECNLRFASFVHLTMKKTQFLECSLKEANFTETDLFGAAFLHSDLTGAVFNRTDLRTADLRSAYGFSIDPGLNKVKKARFSRSGLPGLLQKYDLIVE